MGHKRKLVRGQRRVGQGGLLLWAVSFDCHVETLSFQNLFLF